MSTYDIIVVSVFHKRLQPRYRTITHLEYNILFNNMYTVHALSIILYLYMFDVILEVYELRSPAAVFYYNKLQKK